ncbi:MAG: alpha/beta hydrolase [Desulfobacteraceae bacterium]|jgi:pimeloyl-ACP methyl ester carboxylesterase
MNIFRKLFSVSIFVFLFAASLYAATVDNISIHSSISGNGTKTIVLVHGWTCDETFWKFQVPALSKYYKVITIDLPGHGKSQSPKVDKFSLDLFARSIEAVRFEARTDRIVLAGHSMGTSVIIKYAQLFPQHVAALVFVDGNVTLPHNAGRNNSVADQLAGQNGLKVREKMIRGLFSPATKPEIQKHMLSVMLSAPDTTAVGAIKAMFDRTQWKEQVFLLPVLGLYTDNSTAANHEYMKTHYPNMEYKEIPGTGHFLMLEKPDEFNRLLLEFLDKQVF